MNPQQPQQWPPPQGAWGPPPAPPARPRNASIVPALIVAVLLVAGVGAGGFFWGLSTRSADPVATADPAVRAPAALGDERAVDPCAVLSEQALTRFGTSELYPDFGELASCRIDLTTTSGEPLAVAAYLNSAADVDEVTGGREALGELEIRRPVPSDTACDRWIVLADGTGVQLLVTRTVAGAADLCAVADAAATSAAVVLADTAPLPTRTVPAPSDRLAALDVCALPAATLSSVPGLDVGRLAVGFGGWGCTWGSLSDTWFRVVGNRTGPYEGTGAAPSTVGGRQVWTSDYGTPAFCEMGIVLDTYVGPTGNPRVNVVTVQLGSSADPCGQLRQLAPALVAAVPA